MTPAEQRRAATRYLRAVLVPARIHYGAPPDTEREDAMRELRRLSLDEAEALCRDLERTP